MDTTGRTARWLLAVGLLVVSVLTPGTARAYWSGDGAGVATAQAATVVAPQVTVQSPQLSDRVRVSWTAADPPSGMTVLGYRVTRLDGGTPSNACGTSAAAPLAPSARECVDTSLPDGTFTYVVTADVGPWTASAASAPVTVAADRTGPVIVLGGTAATNALIDRRSGSDLLFFRPGAPGGGSISITAQVTDDGVGPESAAFPAVTTPLWSHAAETVTTGAGSGASVTYLSSPLSFQQGATAPQAIAVTARDTRGNTTIANLTAVADTTPPTGGALRVNGVNASGAGTTSTATGDYVIDTVTAYAEAPTATAAGIASSVLMRESATINAGTCGTFGGATLVEGTVPISESGLPTGCYRYTLTGTDRVGNAASVQTTVRVDTTAPDSGVLTVNGTDAVPGGVNSTAAATAWPLLRTDFTDADSGMTSSVLTRRTAPLTGGACGAFGTATTLTGAPTQSGLATNCYRYLLVGANAFGLTSSLEVTVLADTVAPTGGAFSVNGTAASAASPSTTSTTDTVTISGVVNYTDANIGIASSVLTRAVAPMSAGVCGTYADEIPVVGSGTFTVSGLESACHRFTLRGTDLAGNTVAISRIVRVDTTPPVGGTLNVNGLDASAAGTLSWSADNAWDALWSHFSDPESGVTAVSLVRTQNTLSNGVCTGTYGTTTTYANTLTPTSGTTAQTGLGSGRCYRYILTGRNAFNVASTLTTIVAEDTSAPTTGAMSVNGSAASAAGSFSNNGTGSFSLTVTSAGADTNSGVTTTLVRTQSVFTAPGVCDPAFTSPQPLAFTVNTALAEGPVDPGCYRYTLTVTNGAGTAVVVMSTVRVDLTGPVGGALTVNGVDATDVGSTSTAVAAGFSIARTDWTDPETVITSVLTRASATLTAGTCGAFGTATTLTGAPVQTGLTTACYRYVLTGTNTVVPPALTLTTIVKLDTSAPASGAFTVGGAVASGTGGTANLAAGANFSVTAFTAYSDGQSGMAGNTFTRTTGVSTGGVCGSFDPATTVTLSNSTQTQNGLPNACYRYSLTGTNAFGGTATVIATVRVGP